MLNRITLIAAFLFAIVNIAIAQETPKKEKFVSEKTLHIKVGTTANYVNTRLFNLLNGASKDDVFTPARNLTFNPSVDIEFDNQFSKHFGLNIDLGFMQIRHKYICENLSYNQANSSIPLSTKQEGVILCNIPHFNISPSFYLGNTRFNAGFGLYKYYYAFRPMGVGNLQFDLNSEELLVYSQVGIAQSFDIKTYKLTVSANYFGLMKSYDQGFQLALGFAL